MDYAPLLQIKENSHLGTCYGVVGSYIALYLVHLGYQ